MANISPGVYTKIIDLSSYVAGVPSTIGFLPIISERGVENQLAFTNSVDFYRDFGEPNINYVGKQYGQGPYIASSFLKESEALYTIRCLPEDATWANLCLVLTQDDVVSPTVHTLELVSNPGYNTTNELETAVNISEDNIVVFYGVGRGEWYNNFQIKISEHANPQMEGVFVLDIYMRQSEDDPESGGPQYEIIDTFEVSFDHTQLDASGESLFIEDVVNRYSRFVRCKANTEYLTEILSTAVDTRYLPTGNTFSTPCDAGPVNLDEGSSGSLFAANGVIDDAVALQLITKAYNGTLLKSDGELLYDVLDLDNIYFTIVLDGGYPTDVKTAGIYPLVQTRKDCVALIDNGDNPSIQSALDKRTNDHTFNTRYMALYEPYSKIYDSYTGRDIWVSPIYHMANIVPYTDNVAEIWSAPAGFNRATIAVIKELRFSPLLGDRDRFHLAQINPIVKFNVGYTVWGQLTTQKRPTALQDVNIIRLVLYIKRALEQFCKFYVFELNDNTTWSKVKTEINKFLKTIQNKRGLYEYDVEVSATEYELKAKQFHIACTLTPIRVVEQIFLNFFIK